MTVKQLSLNLFFHLITLFNSLWSAEESELCSDILDLGELKVGGGSDTEDSVLQKRTITCFFINNTTSFERGRRYFSTLRLNLIMRSINGSVSVK